MEIIGQDIRLKDLWENSFNCQREQLSDDDFYNLF